MTETLLSERSHQELGLSDEQAVELYRLMVTARAIDDRIWALNRQGRVGITAPSRGQEAAQIGCIRAFDARRDIFVPYYRDLGMVVGLGFSPYELLLDALGRASGPFSGGRQMPFHWTGRSPRLLSPSSSVGTHLPHAVGAALAARQRGERAATLASFGDGATSKGDFHEALNFAAVWKLPVIFFCENNQYAISVPLARQMAVRDVADRASAYGMPGLVVDGNDVLAVYATTRQAIEQALSQPTPILIEAKTYRLMPHTSNDNDLNYRTAEEVERWRGRDPIRRYEAYLRQAALLDEAAIAQQLREVEAEVEEATRQALAAPEPAWETAVDHLYAPGTLNVPRLERRAIRQEQVEALRSEVGA